MSSLTAMPALGRSSVTIVGHETKLGEMGFFPSWHGTAEHPVCSCLLQVNDRQRTTATTGTKKGIMKLRKTPTRTPTSSTLRKQRQYRAATEERHAATNNTQQPQQHKTTLICTYQQRYRYHISLKNTTAAAVTLVTAVWRRTWWGKRKAERDRTPSAHKCASHWPSPPVAATTATTAAPTMRSSSTSNVAGGRHTITIGFEVCCCP